MGISPWLVFTAGIVAAFNSCGVALLPSYISYLVGSDDKKMSNSLALMIRGAGLRLSMTNGFLIIFVAAGFTISFIGIHLFSH